MKKKTLRTLTALGAAAPLVVTTAALAPAEPTPLLTNGTMRIAGVDRFATSAAISEKSFTTPQQVAFVASGEDFPDALAGGAAAAKSAAPLLLTARERIPTATAEDLDRLQPTKIYVLGGAGPVADATLDALEAVAPTERISGADRYATAAEISKAMFTDATTVYVASGLGFADALSGGPAAAKEQAPLLLTETTTLPDATKEELARLTPSDVKILGGTGAIAESVEDQIRAALPDATITRYAGADRYGTAAQVAEDVWAGGSRTVFYASGKDFPDGLSATPAAAINGAPLLLSTSTCMPRATSTITKTLNPALSVFTGGASVVSTSTTVCGTKPTPPTTPKPPTTPPPPDTPPLPDRDYDCKDFKTWREAQDMYERYLPTHGDVFRLDADDDGIACENLPGAP